jgi:hypothetical protein
MPLFNIDFEWQRDDAGYDYVPAAAGTPSPSEMSPLYAIISEGLSLAGRPARIVRRGGNLVPYRPFDGVNGLYRIFANLGTSDRGLLDFVNRFGPLTKYGNSETGEEVLFGKNHAESMRDLLSCSTEERGTYLSRSGEAGTSWSHLDVALAFNPVTGKPQFSFKPPELCNALWLEFGAALVSDASLRNCLHCGGWFEAGPGTGRREDAKFCCDSHRIAFNSRKRKKEINDDA